jgi:hypothetical protein
LGFGFGVLEVGSSTTMVCGCVQSVIRSPLARATVIGKGGSVSWCRPGSFGSATNDSVTLLLVAPLSSLRSTLGPAPPSGSGKMKPAPFKALASAVSA